MTIFLFQGGAPGRVVILPGENPEAELAELLEGEIAMLPFGRCYRLVRRKDGEDLQLPIRYVLERHGRAPEPIAGDCAAVAFNSMGWMRRLRAYDLSEIMAHVRPTGGV